MLNFVNRKHPMTTFGGKEKTAKPVVMSGHKNGTQTGTRTQDQLVKSQLLYQLSYLRVRWLDCPATVAAGRGGLGSSQGFDKPIFAFFLIKVHVAHQTASDYSLFREQPLPKGSVAGQGPALVARHTHSARETCCGHFLRPSCRGLPDRSLGSWDGLEKGGALVDHDATRPPSRRTRV